MQVDNTLINSNNSNYSNNSNNNNLNSSSNNNSRIYTIPTVYNIRNHLKRQKNFSDEYQNDGLDYEFGYAGCEDLMRIDNDKEYFKTALKKLNVSKNRYNDVLALDSSRVILKGLENDYINANYIPGSGFKFENCMNWILTQGPSEETSPDFWYMIFQEDVELIVMLCKTIEDGHKKCSHYWPYNNEDKVFNIITNEKISQNLTNNITNNNFNSINKDNHIKHSKFPSSDITSIESTSESTESPISFKLRSKFSFFNFSCSNKSTEREWPTNPKIIKQLRVRKLEQIKIENCIKVNKFAINYDGKEKIVTHFQYTDWPDHMTPSEFSTFRNLMLMVQSYCLKPEKVVVHCSAGIGRSATFVAIMILKESLMNHMKQIALSNKKEEQYFDFEVFETVRQLRNYRSGSVQHKSQYEFIYTVLDQEARSLGYQFPDNFL